MPFHARALAQRCAGLLRLLRHVVAFKAGLRVYLQLQSWGVP